MTREEKYKDYRKEIEQYYSEDKVSNKKKSSNRVDLIKKKSSDESIRLSYDDVMDTYKIYDNNNKKRTNLFRYIDRNRFLFILISSIIILALITALIILGIKIFGGN